MNKITGKDNDKALKQNDTDNISLAENHKTFCIKPNK